MQTFNMRHDVTGRRSRDRVVITGTTDKGGRVAFSVAPTTMGQIASHATPGGITVAARNMRHDEVEPDHAGGEVNTFNMRHDALVTATGDGGARVSGRIDGDTTAHDVAFTLDRHGLGNIAHLC